MNNEQFIRTINLIGKDNFDKIQSKKVIVFGCGGVGGYVIEALIRSGIKYLDVVDNDRIEESNINRQIIATFDVIGMMKTDAIKKRAMSINDDIIMNTYNIFFLPENSYLIDFSKYDYVIDCIDTITAKIEIIRLAKENGVKVISSMGTGNKIDSTKFEICDINQTSVCPLARIMRYELKKRNISGVKVLYSKEKPVDVKKPEPGTIAYVPSVAGLLIANYVINDIIK